MLTPEPFFVLITKGLFFFNNFYVFLVLCYAQAKLIFNDEM